jgi:hypothetical protein
MYIVFEETIRTLVVEDVDKLVETSLRTWFDPFDADPLCLIFIRFRGPPALKDKSEESG